VAVAVLLVTVQHLHNLTPQLLEALELVEDTAIRVLFLKEVLESLGKGLLAELETAELMVQHLRTLVLVAVELVLLDALHKEALRAATVALAVCQI
jgi:hypothetical protein